ncbi:MAG: hypothetical protein LBJ38_01565 [Oscillospiraceae bacterium]|jgi:hypothetical protein|nr:hypothetical protein [Oscillospiraceae bacterium]
MKVSKTKKLAIGLVIFLALVLFFSNVEAGPKLAPGDSAVVLFPFCPETNEIDLPPLPYLGGHDAILFRVYRNKPTHALVRVATNLGCGNIALSDSARFFCLAVDPSETPIGAEIVTLPEPRAHGPQSPYNVLRVTPPAAIRSGSSATFLLSLLPTAGKSSQQQRDAHGLPLKVQKATGLAAKVLVEVT